MATRSLAGAEWYIVRLSQVPEHIRVREADRLIELEGLTGTQMIMMKLAAINPVEDPRLKVRRTKLRYGGIRP